MGPFIPAASGYLFSISLEHGLCRRLFLSMRKITSERFAKMMSILWPADKRPAACMHAANHSESEQRTARPPK